MIVFAYLILFSFVLLFSFNKFHKIVNITSTFSGIWFLFGAFSCFGFYGMRIPKITVHIYVWIFVLIIDAVFWLFAKNKVISSNVDEAVENSFRVKSIQIVALLLIIPLFLKVISLFHSSNNMATIRELYFSGTNFSSIYQDLFFRIIPMAFFSVLIIYYTFFSFETKQYKYLFYALLNTIFVTLINGGRYALISLLYTIVILWITGQIRVSDIIRVIKYKKVIKKICVAVILVMVIITLNRGQTIMKSIMIYFTGSLSYLDYIIEHSSQFALDRHLYGYLTFGAIIEPVVLILKALGLTEAKVPSYEFNIYAQKYYDIGNGSTPILYNANTTAVYYFLRDFGTVGVVIGALFIGLFAVKAYNRWRHGDRFWGLIFMYLGSVMFNSLMTYQLIGSAPILIAFAFYFCVQKKFVIKRK